MDSPSFVPAPDWSREARLDEHLRFARASVRLGDARGILLTGASGFLGAHLLAELLERCDAPIDCLVRGADANAARQRLEAHLRAQGVGRPELAGRVRVLAGDLAQPRLGLTRDEHDALAERVELVVHAGAEIHFLNRYAALAPVNVGGTRALIELAARGRPKALHFVSSLAVHFGRSDLATATVHEHERPTIEGLRGGYAQSKWVAEALLRTAAERGLATAVHRTARISGHSRTGAISNWQDLLLRLIRACVVLGARPRLDLHFALLPVDYVSRVIVRLAEQGQTIGRSYNISHPRPIAWDELIDMVGEHGYPMRTLPYDAWREALRQAGLGPHPERDALGRLWMLLGSADALFRGRPRFTTQWLDEGLAGSGITCPELDAPLVATYVRFLQASGFLPSREHQAGSRPETSGGGWSGAATSCSSSAT